MSRLIFTGRDHALYYKLADYGLLSTRQIEDMLFRGVQSTTVLRRLRRLEGKGNLLRTVSSPHVWTLSDVYADLYGGTPYGPVNRNTIPHEVAVSSVRWALERSGIGQAWKPGHVLRKNSGSTRRKRGQAPQAIPDGLFVVNDSGIFRSVALELELHLKARKRYTNVFHSYWEKRNLWKLWYVVRDDRMGKRVLEKGPTFLHQERPGFIVYSTLDEVIKDPIHARVVSLTETKKLGELFGGVSSNQKQVAQNLNISPAQAPAHPLSMEEKISSIKNISNSPNTKEDFELDLRTPDQGRGLTYGSIRGGYEEKQSSNYGACQNKEKYRDLESLK